MPQTPRLNNVIRCLEEGQIPIATFSPPTIDSAIALSTTAYDAVIFECEHNPYDIKDLRDCLQYMLNRRQIVERGSLSPAVTPMVRIPANGGDMNQWLAKQVLDIGVYGVVWPRVSTVEQAYNAVASCRYPRPRVGAGIRAAGAARRQPGARGALLGHHAAGVLRAGRRLAAGARRARSWSSSCARRRRRSTTSREILKEVPGIGVVLIGEGDLSQNLGYPAAVRSPGRRRRDDRAIRRICKEHGVACGHPHVDAQKRRKDRGRRLPVRDGRARADASRDWRRAGKLPEGPEDLLDVVVVARDHDHQRPGPHLRQRLRERVVSRRGGPHDEGVRSCTRFSLQASPDGRRRLRIGAGVATITTRSAVTISWSSRSLPSATADAARS